jgi:hypothetical protein
MPPSQCDLTSAKGDDVLGNPPSHLLDWETGLETRGEKGNHRLLEGAYRDNCGNYLTIYNKIC